MKRHNIVSVLLLLLFTVSGLQAYAVDYLLQIEPSAQGEVKAYRMNGIEVRNNESVSGGEKIRLIATIKDANYIFDHFSVENGSAVSMESDGKGVFTAGTGKVKVKALFAGKPQKLTLAEVTGKQGRYKVIWNGKTLKNGDQIPYGSSITINGLPLEGFVTDQILVNESPLTVQNNSATYIVKENLHIKLTFTEKMIAVSYAPKAVSGVVMNVYHDDSLIEPGGKVRYGTKLYFEMTSSSYYFSLALNNKDCPLNYVKENTCGYTVVATEDLTATIYGNYTRTTPTCNITESVQTEIYDGKPKAFTRFVTPIALQHSELIVTYQPKGSQDQFTEQPPTEAGTYIVHIFRASDRIYNKVNKTSGMTLQINPGTVSILTAPSVTLLDGKISLSGGVAVFAGQEVKGTFSLKSGNEIPSGSCMKDVIFTPESKNLSAATCMIPCIIDEKPLQEYTIRTANIPQGTALNLMNGEKAIQSGEKVPAGTIVTISTGKLPAGKQVAGYINQLSETSYEPIASPLTIDKDYAISVRLENDPNLPEDLIVDQNKIDQQVDYKGKPALFSIVALASLPFMEFLDFKYWTFYYKERSTGKSVVAPIDAGVYDVDICYMQSKSVNAFKGKGTLTIKPVQPKITGLDALAVTEVLPGQTLASSIISGGTTNVIGEFVWTDPTQRVAPNRSYSISFVPFDKRNYETMPKIKQIVVPVSNDANRMAITTYAEHGDIKMRNKITNTEVRSGDIVSPDDLLTITAVPAAGYTLKNLMVDGNAILNGTTYTVQHTPPVILGEFAPLASSAPTYTVTLPIVTGAIVSHAGINEVVEGSSFSFTIDYDLLYGAPTVTAGKKAVANDGAGRYTINEVTQDTTIAIKLDKYGHYTLSVPEETVLGQIKVEKLDAETLRTDATDYTYGSWVRLTATPVNGVTFKCWWDGETENPREYILRGNQTIRATFTGIPTDNAVIDSQTQIYAEGRSILVQPTGGSYVRILDLLGKTVHLKEISTREQFPMEQAGIYIVTLYQNNKVLQQQKIRIR